MSGDVHQPAARVRDRSRDRELGRSKGRACAKCGTWFQPVAKARYCSAECRCGTDAGYNAGCHCTACTKAHALARNLSRAAPRPLVPALGTHRRIQALGYLGWSCQELSLHMGKHRSYVLKLFRTERLEAATAARIAELFEELCMTPCPSRSASRTAAEARARGWWPPLAWLDIDDPDEDPGRADDLPLDAELDDDVDEVLVQRILDGNLRRAPRQPLPGNAAERTAVREQWLASGRSLSALEKYTGWELFERHAPRSGDGAAA